MSLGTRDQAAYDVVTGRSFAGAHVVSLELEMQARRLTLALYGAFRAGDDTTYLATLTFFGTSACGMTNDAGVFPESVEVASLALDYDETADEGSAQLAGAQSWSLAWRFEGLAYEEHAAVLASLADDL